MRPPLLHPTPKAVGRSESPPPPSSPLQAVGRSECAPHPSSILTPPKLWGGQNAPPPPPPSHPPSCGVVRIPPSPSILTPKAVGRSECGPLLHPPPSCGAVRIPPPHPYPHPSKLWGGQNVAPSPSSPPKLWGGPSPSQKPFLSIWALTETRPSGMNMQDTFFSFLAATGDCREQRLSVGRSPAPPPQEPPLPTPFTRAPQGAAPPPPHLIHPSANYQLSASSQQSPLTEPR